MLATIAVLGSQQLQARGDWVDTVAKGYNQLHGSFPHRRRIEFKHASRVRAHICNSMLSASSHFKSNAANHLREGVYEEDAQLGSESLAELLAALKYNNFILIGAA